MKNKAPEFTRPGMKNQTSAGVGGVKNPNKSLECGMPGMKNQTIAGVGGEKNPNASNLFDLNSKGNGSVKPSASRSIPSMINSKFEL
jgi:hypothetical protein